MVEKDSEILLKSKEGGITPLYTKAAYLPLST
jgi:hypothetical protein